MFFRIRMMVTALRKVGRCQVVQMNLVFLFCLAGITRMVSSRKLVEIITTGLCKVEEIQQAVLVPLLLKVGAMAFPSQEASFSLRKRQLVPPFVVTRSYRWIHAM